MGGIHSLAIYDGVVNLAGDEIPVIVELGSDHVRMSAAGTEIGHWPADECHITHVENGVYTIAAEAETLQFVPSQPGLFAAAVNGGLETSVVNGGTERDPDAAMVTREAPPPRPLTMGLFYALCVTTTVLAVWALISILF